METTNLGLSGDSSYIKELLDSYANNPEKRKKLIEQMLVTNVFNPDIDFSDDTISNNIIIFNEYLAALGIEIINNDGVSSARVTPLWRTYKAS